MRNMNMIMFRDQMTGKTVITDPITCEFICDDSAAVVITKAGNRYAMPVNHLAALLDEHKGAGVKLIAIQEQQPTPEAPKEEAQGE